MAFKTGVCYYKKELGAKKSMQEMYDNGIGDLIFSKFDSKACLISPKEGNHHVPLDNGTIEIFKKCFEKCIP